MNTNQDNKTSIDKESLLEQSVQIENNVEVQDYVSEIDEEYLDSEIKEDNSDSESEEYECDTCDKLFENKDELDKHVTNTGIQCGFCHYCVVKGEELNCPELRKCVEMEHWDFSWHPTLHVFT